MRLELSLPPKHAACLLSDAKHKVLVGGRAAGKSTGAADLCIGRAVEKRRKIVCARQFQKSIEHSSKSLIESRIEKLGLRDQFVFTDQSIRHVNGSEFAFIGLERNVDSVRGLDSVDLWWVEEARNVSQLVLDVLLPTMRKQGCEVVWTYNPVNRDDPVDAYFRGPNLRADACVVLVTYEDNPFFDLTSARVEMEHLRAHNRQAYEHIWLARYDERASSRVFDNWRVGYADGEALPIPPLYGLDHGFSVDPTALLKIIPFSGNRLFIADERIAHRRSLDLLPGLLGSFLHNPDAVVWADSARTDINDYLRRHGFPNVVDTPKPPGSIVKGVTRLQAFEVIIAPHCENFLAEVHGYSWPVNPLTRIVVPGEPPIGGFDHLLDCARYCTTDHLPVVVGADDEKERWDDGGVTWMRLARTESRYSPYPYH